MTAPTRIYVYGSCVARDTVTALPPEAYSLVGYIARHSLLAAGSDASAKLPNNLGLSSSFQERMVRLDWAGGALKQMIDNAHNIDLLLWDLIDERHGVHWFLSGEVITRSIDLLQSETAMAQVETNTHVAFGSDVHFENWSAEARKFVEHLDEAGLKAKTRLIKTTWASQTSTGTPTPPSMGVSADTANSLYERYYDFLSAMGVLVIEVPQNLIYASSEHRWGVAPFHYSDDVYTYIINRLQAGGFLPYLYDENGASKVISETR